MQPLVTRHQSRELDRIAIQERGIPGLQLMGSAGAAVADWILTQIQPSSSSDPVAIVCGKGNNGGDGFAAALKLVEADITVDIYSLVSPDDIQGDARHFFLRCQENSIPIQFAIDPPNRDSYSVVVDAILGTGFQGELRETLIPWTEWINRAGGHIVAIDVPTGVDAETGLTADHAVRADTTITMGYVKVGMTLEPGKTHCGEIRPVDIGFPDIFQDLPGRKCYRYTREEAHQDLPSIPPDTYKHNQGKVLIIAGSRGMTGAAALTTFGALRTGAGLTITLAPASLEPVYESLIMEGMTRGVPDNGEGRFTSSSLNHVLEWVEWSDAVVIGPGLGRHPDTETFLTRLLPEISKPIVIDADGFQPFWSKSLTFQQLKSSFILTPHYGEWAQFGSFPVAEVRPLFQERLSTFMTDFPGVLALKNAPTCVVWEQYLVVNCTGNPGLATAGSGDVYAGICGTFLAQGLPAQRAASLAAYIHGLAGDMCAESQGARGMLARDLLSFIPEVLNELDQAS